MRVVLTGLTARGRRTKSQHKLPEALRMLQKKRTV